MRVPFFQQTTLCRGFELTGQQGHEVMTRGAHLGGFLHTHADKTRTGRQTFKFNGITHQDKTGANSYFLIKRRAGWARHAETGPVLTSKPKEC